MAKKMQWHAKNYTAGVGFDRRSLILTLALQFLQCLGRQALQKLHVSAKNTMTRKKLH